MTVYKRILEIAAADVERMTVGARAGGLNVRKARSGIDGEYVIEGRMQDRKAIDLIVAGYEEASAALAKASGAAS